MSDSVDLKEKDKTQTSLKIDGMTCAACAARIEKGLNRLPGVIQANVNLTMERATIQYNPNEINPSDMIQKVKDLGYGASLLQGTEGKENDREKEINRHKFRFAVSAILSLPLLYTMVAHFALTGFYVPDFLMDPWVQFAFATPVQFVIGWPFYRGGI